MWYRSKTDAATGTTYEVVAPNDCPSLRSANLLALIAANKAIDSGDSTDCKQGEPKTWMAKITMVKPTGDSPTWSVSSVEPYEERDPFWSYQKVDGTEGSATKALYDEIVATRNDVTSAVQTDNTKKDADKKALGAETDNNKCDKNRQIADKINIAEWTQYIPIGHKWGV